MLTADAASDGIGCTCDVTLVTALLIAPVSLLTVVRFDNSCCCDVFADCDVTFACSRDDHWSAAVSDVLLLICFGAIDFNGFTSPATHTSPYTAVRDVTTTYYYHSTVFCCSISRFCRAIFASDLKNNEIRPGTPWLNGIKAR